MKKKYLKILKEINVYSRHDLTSRIVKKLEPQEIIQYNREKRRDGKNWMEIYLDNNKKGYIEKNTGTYFVCESVVLTGDSSRGFNYTQKTNPPLSIGDLFFPADQVFSSKSKLHETDYTIGKIEMKSVENFEENKVSFLSLEYAKELVEVKDVFFTKDEEFYITSASSAFIEVDNFRPNTYNKKGLLLANTKYSNLYDQLMGYIAVGIAILVVVGIFIGFLAAGWLVVSGLMIILGLVIGFVVVFVLQILIMILKGIFDNIRKRF